MVQEERDEAAAQGMAKGRAEEARKVLRRFLNRHFPDLAPLTEIDAISDVDTLESIIETAFDAKSADQVRAAILNTTKPN